MTILAIREEKFFAAFRRGLFDAYGDKRFHIGSPAIQSVLEKRLSFIKSKIKDVAKEDPDSFKDDLDQIISLIDVFTKSTMKTNQNIVRYLSCVSNGDIRLALGMFKTFISSGNLNTDKILNVYLQDGDYTVPFHEFAKSVILGSRKYFKNNTSHTINLFNRSSARHSSYFTAVRILARLSRDASAPSLSGEGYIRTGQILQEYRQCFGTADDLITRGSELLSRGLVESEPPRITSLEQTDALHITASGEYYWKYLVRSFAYLDLVYLDTPLTDKDTSRQLVKLSNGWMLDNRFERVKLFLDFLSNSESREQHQIQKSDSPFATPVMPDIIQQINSEIKLIQSKLGWA